jgi:hypothetical protein
MYKRGKREGGRGKREAGTWNCELGNCAMQEAAVES